MIHVPSIRVVFIAALVAAHDALAQTSSTETPATLKLEVPEEQPANRFGLSYRMGFNAPVNFKTPASVKIPASFKNPGVYPVPGTPRYTKEGDLFNYDNGYVLVDSSGNAMGYTRYWGYDSASQASESTITMQKSSSTETISRSTKAMTSGSEDHYDTPMSGIELSYNRELIRKKAWRGGLEAAFGYTHTSVQGGGTDSASLNQVKTQVNTQVQDSYNFPGAFIIVPPAPYQGPKNPPQGPNAPVIIASPSSHTTDSTSYSVSDSITDSMTGRDFSADLFNFRFGPYVEIPISKRIAFTLSGGFALMNVNSEFGFNQQTVTTSGGQSVGLYAHPSGSGNEWLPGGYVAGTFSVALSDSWAFIAGAQFEDVGRYTQTLNGKQATMDLSNSIFVTLGISYSF